MSAFPYDNMAYFERGWCTLSDRVFPSMGFNAYKSKGTTSGKYMNVVPRSTMNTNGETEN